MGIFGGCFFFFSVFRPPRVPWVVRKVGGQGLFLGVRRFLGFWGSLMRGSRFAGAARGRSGVREKREGISFAVVICTWMHG